MWEKVKSLVDSIRDGIAQAKPDPDDEYSDVGDAAEYGDLVGVKAPSWENGYGE